jgi:23S rRNA pseudouridine1911/1915/1917 synthase
LLRLKPKTGRTHQLRVHLADFGFPIVGDKVYGHRRREGDRNADVNTLLDAFPRQTLHAEKLSFVHPATSKPMRFHAPLPQDMQELVKALSERNEP